MTKYEALKQKEAEIQAQLDDWVRNSGLFSAGDAVKISLDLQQISVTVVAERGKRWRHHERRLLEGTRYYRYISTDLSERDWKEIFLKLLPVRVKRIVRILRSTDNKPSSQIDFGSRGCMDTNMINAAFRRCGLRLRLEIVESFEREDGFVHMYQLYKVEPRPPVEKWWKKSVSG